MPGKRRVWILAKQQLIQARDVLKVAQDEEEETEIAKTTTTAAPMLTPRPKSCHTFQLIQAGIDVQGKSSNDRWNACIGCNFHHSSSSVRHFQGMGDWENEGTAAAIMTLKANGSSDHELRGKSEGNQCIAIITLASKCSGPSVEQLQRSKTLAIAQIMNFGSCCKPCYAFQRGFEHFLTHAGIDVQGKSHNHRRNTCIWYNFRHSSSSVGHFQGMGGWENEGAAAIMTLEANGHFDKQLTKMSEGNQRNAIIELATKCSGYSVEQLQGKTTLDIAVLMNSGNCCP